MLSVRSAVEWTRLFLRTEVCERILPTKALELKELQTAWLEDVEGRALRNSLFSSHITPFLPCLQVRQIGEQRVGADCKALGWYKSSQELLEKTQHAHNGSLCFWVYSMYVCMCISYTSEEDWLLSDNGPAQRWTEELGRAGRCRSQRRRKLFVPGPLANSQENPAAPCCSKAALLSLSTPAFSLWPSPILNAFTPSYSGGGVR